MSTARRFDHSPRSTAPPLSLLLLSSYVLAVVVSVEPDSLDPVSVDVVCVELDASELLSSDALVVVLAVLDDALLVSAPVLSLLPPPLGVEGEHATNATIDESNLRIIGSC